MQKFTLELLIIFRALKNFLLIAFLSFVTIPVFADSTSIQQSDSTAIRPDTLKKDTVLTADSVVSGNPQLPIVKKRDRGTELWVFIACCLTFFVAGINRRINEKKHDQSIMGFLKIGILGQATDRSFYEFNIHQLIGLIVHNLIWSFWVFYFLQGTDYQFVDINLLFFILLFFLISIIYFCKFFFQYLALNILQIHDLPVLLVKCTIGLGYLTTLITLPFFMIIYYVQYPEWNDILIKIFLTIVACYLFFRAFKYFQLFIQFFSGSIFYNILYFCGLELIPLLVFIKISMSIF